MDEVHVMLEMIHVTCSRIGENNKRILHAFVCKQHTNIMGKPLPPHLVSRIVIYRHELNKSWIEISSECAVNPDTARQVYERAKKRANDSEDLDEILKHVYHGKLWVFSPIIKIFIYKN